MGGVLDGQAVSAAVTNPAFLDANGDDTGVGKITLANTDPVSGATVDSLQKEHNSAASFMGKALNSVAGDLPAWTTSVVGAAGDSLFDRADALTERFDSTTGHFHDGTAGEGPQILAVNIDAVPLRGFVQQGADILGVTGSSSDVSSSFSGKTPGGSTSVEGVVTAAPENKVIIRQASGSSEDDAFLDALGNVVYGRITESAGVWTLSYFVLIAGVETVYSFASASDVRYYYQEIFNPLGGSAPVFSEFASIPSDNATADVITATTTQQGKVSLSAAAPGNIAATGAAGTATASVANADHTHEGLHSISKSGSAQILGDATLSSAGGVTLTQTLNDIQIDAPALTAVAPQDVGSTNQVGIGTASARADHVHEGVHTVKLSGDPDIYGDVTLAVSNGTTATQAGSTITFSSPALTVTAAQDVGSTGSAGVATDSARSDHVHRGVSSVSKNGSAQLYGNVTFSAGAGITITQTLQDIQIAGSGGGGGGSLTFYDTASPEIIAAPVARLLNRGAKFAFDPGTASGDNQAVFVDVRIPSSYTLGNINLRVSFYTPATTGTINFTVTSYLVRSGTDTYTAPTLFNSTTSSTSAAAVANTSSSATVLISTAGAFGAGTASPGDLIRIGISTNIPTHSITSPVYLVTSASEVTFA
jgi:hypothetical protein